MEYGSIFVSQVIGLVEVTGMALQIARCTHP
jgi:hypothetical protein